MNSVEMEEKKIDQVIQTEEEQLELLSLGLKEIIQFVKEPENIFLKKIYIQRTEKSKNDTVSNENLLEELRKIIDDEKLTQCEKEKFILIGNQCFEFVHVHPLYIKIQETESIAQFFRIALIPNTEGSIMIHWYSFPNVAEHVIDLIRIVRKDFHNYSKTQQNMYLRVVAPFDLEFAELFYNRFPTYTTALIFSKNLIIHRDYKRAIVLMKEYNINLDKYKNPAKIHSISSCTADLLLLENYELKSRVKELEEEVEELKTVIRYSPDGEGMREAEEEFIRIREMC